MDKQKIKRIIAKEGLIVITIAILLYLFQTFVPSLPFPFPKYKLEFQDESSNIIDIYPDIVTSEIAGKIKPKELINKYHYPSLELISKRADKFIRDNKKSSALINAECINQAQLYWYSVYFDLLWQPLFGTIAIYSFLLLIRFIIWAIRTLRIKNG